MQACAERVFERFTAYTPLERKAWMTVGTPGLHVRPAQARIASETLENRSMKSLFVSLILGCLQLSASAHEFWLAAQPVAPAAKGSTTVTLHIGEYFEGAPIGLTAAHAAAIRLHSRMGIEDLGKQVPATGMQLGIKLSFQRPGTHVLTYESHPSQIVLSADKFHAYLHDEGLDAIIARREADGTATQPARERFRRSAKLLLRVGDKSDGTYAVRTQQRVEITPTTDPLSAAVGQPLRFKLRFDGKPLAGVLLKAWHRRGPQTLMIRTVADADGHVTLELPFSGRWLLSAVHMEPVTDSQDLDWDSFWGSLAFDLRSRK